MAIFNLYFFKFSISLPGFYIFLPVVALISFLTKAQINGSVSDSTSKESLSGVVITDSVGHFIGYTNEHGYFLIGQKKPMNLRFSHVGYQTKHMRLLPSVDNYKIHLKPLEVSLSEVSVIENYRDNYENNILKLSAQEIKRYPSLLGEKDLIKVVQTLPGVKRIAEGGSGYSVRGGGADQNLVLLDNVPIYSYNHLFGLFSMFNTDAVKDIEFIKSGIPARYGGRSSSVLNIRLKDGSLNRWEGQGSIGLLSSKASVNGPLIKDKTAILLSARRSYIDLLTKPLMPDNYKQGYVLGDYALKITQVLGKSSRLFAGAYHSSDRYSEERIQVSSPTLRFKSPFHLGWKNTLGYLKFTFADKKSFTTLYAYTSRYHFNYFEKTERILNNIPIRSELLDYKSYMHDTGFNADYDLNLSARQTIRLGAGILNRTFLPRSINQSITETDSLKIQMADIQRQSNFEGYIYAELRQLIGQKTTIIAGLRNVYWGKQTWKAYLEPRISFIYQMAEKSILRLGYFRINQFVHLLSNTGGALPTDMWISVSQKFKPQQSQQISLGYSSEILRFNVELDVYYKRMSGLLMYQQGATFLNLTQGLSEKPSDWEQALTAGNGYSYGLEIYARKNIGKWQGTLSYTLSRTEYTFKELNFGRPFFPKFDRLHDFNLTSTYPITQNTILSSSFLFATGSPITIPDKIYQADRVTAYFTERWPFEMGYYSGINNYRSEAYHRLDVGVVFQKKKKHALRSWEISVFNAYANKNPFYYSMQRKNVDNKGSLIFEPKKQHYLTIIPSVTYSLKY